MNAEPEPGKTIRQIYFIIFCIIILAAWVYIRNLADPEFRPWEIFAVKRDYKQELREQYARYREGNLAATKMLEACADKLAYAGSGKSALAEYIHALRCQVYLDEHKPKMARAEARKAVEVAPEPGRGCIALGDALRALGKDAEAAEAYAQAFRNDNYIQDYTVEDPMSAETLDALCTANTDAQMSLQRWYDNIIIRGKFVGIDIKDTNWASFSLAGTDSGRPVSCFFEESKDVTVRHAETQQPVLGLSLVQVLAFAALPKGRVITVQGVGTPVIARIPPFIDECTVIKIE